MPTNFHIDSRLVGLPDVQRTFLFELEVSQINKVCTSITSPEDLIIRCRSASIPGRGNDPIESVFMGMKQYFPGKPVFGHTLSVVFEEFEDQKITKALYEWRELIFSTDLTSSHPGISGAVTKRGAIPYTSTIFLKMYKYNGDPLEKKIKFVNSYLENIDDVGLDYTGNESIKYNATFRYDYWTLI